jgi:predicted permease
LENQLTVKKLFNPVTMSMLLGAVVGLCGIKLPGFASSFLSKAGACMGPAGMLLTGMVISEYKLRSLVSNKVVYLVAAIRLLVIPFILAAVLKALSLDALVVPALMVMAMPCGLNTIVFPKLVGEDCRPGAALACLSTTAAIITIPLCLTLLL